jgi:hypothetical protein
MYRHRTHASSQSRAVPPCRGFQNSTKVQDPACTTMGYKDIKMTSLHVAGVGVILLTYDKYGVCQKRLWNLVGFFTTATHRFLAGHDGHDRHGAIQSGKHTAGQLPQASKCCIMTCQGHPKMHRHGIHPRPCSSDAADSKMGSPSE